MRIDVRQSILGLIMPLSLAACVGQLGGGGGTGETDPPPPPDPQAIDSGRVTVHRLNHAEYNNTVHDLLGTDQAPASNFPADDTSYGFDNIADTLSLSPVQFELYELTAQALVEEAMKAPVPSATTRYEAEKIGGPVGAASGNAWNLYSNGAITLSGKIPEAGVYKFRVRAWQSADPPDAAHMTLSVGKQTFGYDVSNDSTAPKVFEQQVTVPAGTGIVSVSFDNDAVDPVTKADRNLFVDYIEIEGPIGAAPKNAIRDRIVTCDSATGGDACLREILTAFAERAWRRPLPKPEVDGLMKLVALAKAQGDTDEAGLRVALRAILLHPAFLYRVELDLVPTSETSHPLTDYEMASRLSYFLWSSMPDQALFDAPAAGKLHEDADLDAQVDRLLADPKSRAMVDNFAGQWLYTRELDQHQADPQLFPSYGADHLLADSMKAEADLYFDELLKSKDLGIDALLKSDFTYVDDRLAKHYGLPAPGSATPVRVSTKGSERGGILSQGSMLTVTSNPDRTSPVKRGKWIMSNLLCSQPPDPPKGIAPLPKVVPAGLTARQQLNAHVSNPVCASCHNVMDPLGFGLENYDAIGAWRTLDNGQPIDASGTLPDKTAFKTEAEMASIIGKDPRYPRCVAQKMSTYALGRGVTTVDGPWLDQLTTDFKAKGSRLRELVKLIVKSEAFRTRRGEKGGAQ